MLNFFAFCLLWLPFRGAETFQTQPLPLQSDTCRTGKDTLTGKQVFLNADTGPECEGGTAAWLRHLNKRLHVTDAMVSQIESTCVIAFIVEKDGRLSGLRVVKGSNNDLTKQLFAAVRSIRWIPGRCHGKTVPMLHMLPIIVDFRIE
jgi:Gram-negative bacterial TonB protein C-terminal